MKILLSCLVTSLAASNAVASPITRSIEAEGKVVYQKPDGSLMTRDVTLILPERGQGEIVMRSAAGDRVAKSFHTHKAGNETKFCIIFADHNSSSDLIYYEGTYLRGSNRAMYWGNIYQKTLPSQSDLEDLSNGSENHVGHAKADSKFVGGFKFEAVVDK